MPDVESEVLPLPPARERVRSLWSVVRLAFRADRRRTLLALIPGWPLAVGAIAICGQSIMASNGTDDVRRVIIAAVVAGAVTMAAAAIGYWQAANGSLRMAQVISTEVDDVLLGYFAGAPTLDPFDDPQRRDRLEILRVGRQPLVNVLAAAGGVVQTAAGSLVTAALLATVRPWLAVLPLLVVPIGAVYFRTERAAANAERHVAERRRVALHLYDVGTGPAEGKELRVLAQAQALLDRHDATWAEIDGELSAVATRGLVLRLGAWAAYCAILAGALSVALRQASGAGELEGASVFVVGVAAGQLVFLAFGGATTATSLRNATDIAGHLAAAVDRTDLATSPDRSGEPVVAAPSRITRGVELVGVTFRYQGSERDALGPVELRLPAGTVTAIVGPNGAGKTTLVNLLLGLRHPTAGIVRIDGVDLRDLAPSSWFERSSMVCQDFVRFELSVREGVGAGDLARLDEPIAIRQALDRAEATSIVAGLPGGIDTLVGSGAGSRDLSGGQWQRLAAARGLMRDEPLLLVLDEPTVAMDAISEQRLLERCVAGARRLALERGSVVVFVSHRYATARLADQIAVIDRGVVAELGTHAELVERGGQYADIYRRQAYAYRR